MVEPPPVHTLPPGTARASAAPSGPARGRRAARAVLLALLPALWGCSAERAQPIAAHITVDSTVHYQTMNGWEATAQAGQDDPSFPQIRERVLELAVDTLGIDRVRLQVRAGAENPHDYWSDLRAGRLAGNWRCLRYQTVNDNADPNVIDPKGFQFSDLDTAVEKVVLPLQKRLAARSERLFVNLNYVAFYQQCPDQPYTVHTDPEEYAEFMLATSLHLRSKYHLVPDTWELMLEPDNTPFWQGEQLGRALVATARRLRAAGFTPRFVAPSTTSMAAASPYFDELARVPGALPDLAELSYHRYKDVAAANLRAIAERAARYHLATSMLEHIGSDQKDLYRDLTVGGVSAWQQFTLAYAARDNGAQYLVIEKAPGRPATVGLSRSARFLAQYFRYVRRGALRVGASSDDPGMAPVAFVNPRGRFVVVINADRRGTATVTGLPAGRYALSYATEEATAPESMVTIARGETVAAAIPARGVLTIARK